MINNFLTIVIPCKNDIIGLRKTIESISRKTKISGTSIFVLDFQSTDGSPQYAIQASSEMLKMVRIESIKIEEGESIKDVAGIIKTDYVLTINTGSVFNDIDAILKSINSILVDNQYPIVYLKQSNIFNNIISRFSPKRRTISAVLSKRELVKNMDFEFENSSPEIILDKEVLAQGIKIGGFTD